jgi:TonB family protein
MKFCPTCQTRYDEEILRFCTKDGTPLVEENQPQFTAMPSESSIDDDELNEQTVIRRNNVPPPVPDVDAEPTVQERLVIPTSDQPRAQTVQQQTVTPAPPRKSNTATVVLLTLLGTLAVLGIGFGGWYFLQNRNSGEANNNVNVNTNPPNQNTNVNADNSPANFNFNVDTNTNTNVNTNVNTNANVKTPTPTPTKTPTPTPTKTPTPDVNANVNANVANTNASPTPTPTPRTTPTPTPPQNVNVGMLNSRAVSLPKPAYPPTARQMNASGRVTVQVTIDEEGNVLSAKAINGHVLLRNPAEAAARQSKFNPVRVGGQAVRASGVILYNFINQ